MGIFCRDIFQWNSMMMVVLFGSITCTYVVADFFCPTVVLPTESFLLFPLSMMMTEVWLTSLLMAAAAPSPTTYLASNDKENYENVQKAYRVFVAMFSTIAAMIHVFELTSAFRCGEITPHTPFIEQTRPCHRNSLFGTNVSMGVEAYAIIQSLLWMVVAFATFFHAITHLPNKQGCINNSSSSRHFTSNPPSIEDEHLIPSVHAVTSVPTPNHTNYMHHHHHHQQQQQPSYYAPTPTPGYNASYAPSSSSSSSSAQHTFFQTPSQQMFSMQ